MGIPCSGKSTWAKKFVLDNPDYVRVCRDDLRKMRGKYWLPEQEDMITAMEDTCIVIAVHRGFSVVVDATNLNPKTIERITTLGNVRAGVNNSTLEIEYKMFDINLDEAISRDMGRPKEEQVGAKVITDFYNKYIASKKIQELESNKAKLVQNTELPKILISDIDGTVCLMNGRNAFDYTKVINDLPNEPVCEILRGYTEGIIFVSGREDYCKEDTIKWLKLNNLWVDGLSQIFMRKTGDHRDDRIVKKEIFDNHIKDKYFVKAVFDDRPKVIRMWLGMGLFVFNVGDGHEF